jgi:hypothetical protein
MKIVEVCLMAAFVLCAFTTRAELSCGGSDLGIINTTYQQHDVRRSGDFVLTIVNAEITTHHKITQGMGYLRMRCDKLPDGRAVLIVNPWCSGRACEMEALLGVIDVKDGQYLVELPRDYRGSTREAAEQLLQKKIAYFSCEEGHHIAAKTDKSGDICLATAREQG